MRMIIVGDPHLNNSTPLSRIDSYPETTLKKLESLRSICLREKVQIVVLLGDVFHKPQQSLLYLNKIMEVLQKFKDSEISVYSIVGNHDIYYENMDSLYKTAIQVLFNSGLLIHLKDVTISHPSWKLVLTGYDYPDPVEKATEEYHAFAAHRFYENTFTETSLKEAFIKASGYCLALLGHDHVYFPPKQVGSCLVIRPGAFTRGTSHSYQLERQVTVSLITMQDTPGTFKVEELPIEQSPAEEVFSQQAYHKNPSKNKVMERLSDLMESLKSQEDSTDLEKLVRNLDLDSASKTRLLEYFRAHGIFI